MKTSTPLKLIIPIFLITLCGYLVTLNPALFRNDTPETITGCITLGITHPPGYPLFNLIGKCFNTCLIGNPAFTYNFMASLLASIGACLLCVNLWMLFSKIESLNSFKISYPAAKHIACFTASFLLAFSNGYWGNAIAAKGGVYILQTILELIFLIFFQIVFFKESTTKTKPYFLFFLFLVGGLNHWPSQILLTPALLVIAFFEFQSHKKPKPFMSVKSISFYFALSITVLSVYLYLPLRSHLYPILNFDAPYTWHRFIGSILRTDYTKTELMDFHLKTYLEELNQKSIYISQHIFKEFHPSAYVFIVIGFFQLNKINKKATLFYLLLFLTLILINLFYLQVNPIEFWHMDDHLLSSNWILALFIGLGIYTSFNETKRFQRRRLKKNAPIILSVLFSLLIPFTFIQNFSENNQKNQLLYYGYGLTALKSLPKHSVYFSESDYDCFSTLYLKTILNKRPDLHLLMSVFLDKPYERELILKTDRNLLSVDSYKSKNSVLFDLIQNNYKLHPIYCTFANAGFSELYLKTFKKMKLAPSGILTHVIQTNKLMISEPLYEPLKSFWDQYLGPEIENPSPNQGLLRQACASPYLNAALYEKLNGHWEHWDWYYSKAVDLISEPTWLAQTWLARAEGDAYSGNNLEAEKNYNVAAYYFIQLGQSQNAQMALKKAKNLSSTFK